MENRKTSQTTVVTSVAQDDKLSSHLHKTLPASKYQLASQMGPHWVLSLRPGSKWALLRVHVTLINKPEAFFPAIFITMLNYLV